MVTRKNTSAAKIRLLVLSIVATFKCSNKSSQPLILSCTTFYYLNDSATGWKLMSKKGGSLTLSSALFCSI